LSPNTPIPVTNDTYTFPLMTVGVMNLFGGSELVFFHLLMPR